LSGALVEVLIREFDLVAVADGEPILNPVTHWEPSPKLRILVRRITHADPRHQSGRDGTSRATLSGSGLELGG
jgi:hypothetical protein